MANRLHITINPGPSPYRYQTRGRHYFYDLPVSSAVRFVACGGLVEVYGRVMVVRAGYAWDGPSGPAIDTITFARASMLHDALYQAMREGVLTPSCRRVADGLMYREAVACGMAPLRAWYAWVAVRLFAGWAARPKT